MYANYSKSKWEGEKRLKVIAAYAAGYEVIGARPLRGRCFCLSSAHG